MKYTYIYIYIFIVSFKLFDFDNNKVISLNEMVMMFKFSTKGVGTFTSTKMPSHEELLQIGKMAFHTADMNADQTVEWGE